LYLPPYTDEGQIWCVGADPRSTLSRQISSECVHCVGLQWTKKHNFGQILTFQGTPVSTPFYRWGPNLVCYSRPAVYAYVPNFVSISLFCRPLAAKNPQFLPYFGLRHLVLSPIGNSLTKSNTGAQLQTFPYPTVLKSFLYSNAVMAKSGAQSLTFKRVTNKQTDKKTQRFWPPRRRVKSELHQTWHGDRGPRSRSCTSKTVGGLTHSFAATGRWNLGITRPCQLKTPITASSLEQI